MRHLASALFLSVGRIASHLPKFRGKNGAFLRLFDALGLRSHHVIVDAVLQAPTEYRVRLDLHSWLQRLAFVSGEYEAGTVSFWLAFSKALGVRGTF